MANRFATFRLKMSLTIAATLIVGLVGCGDMLKQPYPAKAYFGIDPGLPESSSTRPATEIAIVSHDPSTRPTVAEAIFVRTVRVVPPYDGAAFVIQKGADQYQSDYYSNWIAPPAALLTSGLTDWLEHTGFGVVTPGASIRPELALESEVSRLVINRTTAGKPKAEVTVRFFLTRETEGGTQILFNHSFAASQTAESDTPAAYAAATGLAYRQVLHDVAALLRDSMVE